MTTGRAGIPRTIHQTWNDRNVPKEWRAFQKTWIDLHPEWDYRLWTNEDNRAFLEEHHSWFLPVYDAYDQYIKKVDAVRYFILHRHGGVFVDLDFECLRPLDDLLVGRELVIGLEPEAHLHMHVARRRRLHHILCSALMAARPGHPFWEHVFKCMLASRRAVWPLDATGPFC